MPVKEEWERAGIKPKQNVAPLVAGAAASTAVPVAKEGAKASQKIAKEGVRVGKDVTRTVTPAIAEGVRGAWSKTSDWWDKRKENPQPLWYFCEMCNMGFTEDPSGHIDRYHEDVDNKDEYSKFMSDWIVPVYTETLEEKYELGRFCPHCHGRGYVGNNEPCPMCHPDKSNPCGTEPKDNPPVEEDSKPNPPIDLEQLKSEIVNEIRGVIQNPPPEKEVEPRELGKIYDDNFTDDEDEIKENPTMDVVNPPKNNKTNYKYKNYSKYISVKSISKARSSISKLKRFWKNTKNDLERRDIMKGAVVGVNRCEGILSKDNLKPETKQQKRQIKSMYQAFVKKHPVKNPPGGNEMEDSEKVDEVIEDKADVVDGEKPVTDEVNEDIQNGVAIVNPPEDREPESEEDDDDVDESENESKVSEEEPADEEPKEEPATVSNTEPVEATEEEPAVEPEPEPVKEEPVEEVKEEPVEEIEPEIDTTKTEIEGVPAKMEETDEDNHTLKYIGMGNPKGSNKKVKIFECVECGKTFAKGV